MKSGTWIYVIKKENIIQDLTSDVFSLIIEIKRIINTNLTDEEAYKIIHTLNGKKDAVWEYGLFSVHTRWYEE